MRPKTSLLSLLEPNQLLHSISSDNCIQCTNSHLIYDKFDYYYSTSVKSLKYVFIVPSMRPNVLPTLHSLFDYLCNIQWPIPGAVWYMAWVCGLLLPGIVGPNSDRGPYVSAVCCHL